MRIDSSLNTGEDIGNAVLDTLRYYSLFHYPLKADEIYGSLLVRSSLACLLVELEDLENAAIIYKHDGYYSLDKEVERLVAERKKANALARLKKNQAMKVGKFIYRFPFVRFAGISGSLSKGYANPESDFDFFIVTAKNRLWICRTLLHLFKKITFLFGQQHKFCMNYFIDTANLELNEKNRFTSIELSSLVPAAGYDTYLKLKLANHYWVDAYLPNGYVGCYSNTTIAGDNKSIIKAGLEFFFNSLFPAKLNKALMQITDRKWRKKWMKKNYPMEDYEVAFKTTLHVSKNHPANHQKRVLKALSTFDHTIATK